MVPAFTPLENRGILQLAGADAQTFLQALITADINKSGEKRALYGALLTPQGKYLHDFFILQMAGVFYLDAEKARLADLKKRLLLYKLRSDVTIADATGAFCVYAFFGTDALAKLDLGTEEGTARPFEDGLLYVDPRLAAAGARALLPRAATPDPAGFSASDAIAYDRFRIGLGLPDGSRDLIPEKSVLLDYGFDELHGIAWKKGCYVGQEVTVRTKHRGLTRKRLLPVVLEGETPGPGAPVTLGDREIGKLTSVLGTNGLALLQLGAIEDARENNQPLLAGKARLLPVIPSWMRL